MILPGVKKTLIFNEISDAVCKQYFDLSKNKFIHNIDSLYYVVKVKNDWNHDPGCITFRDYLDQEKTKANQSHDPHVLFQENKFLYKLGSEHVTNGIGSAPYLYDIEKKDKYMMFVMGHQLNDKTPEIWIQIRSQFLWLYGQYAAVSESLADVERILRCFNIEIEEVKENRIDFAYHTNYIQDFLNFFKEEDMNRMQVSGFGRYSREGKFVGESDVEVDYITLGAKKSNNLFFRAYNKTKEVIEKGYKQFFIKLWYMEKLINYFDFYCIEKAFKQGSYNYLDVARLEFYLEFGSNESFKNLIKNELKGTSKNYESIRKLADQLVPKVTLVTNIEIETKRKFYYSMDESVNSLLKLKSTNVPDYAKKLYVKLDNMQVFHNYLTCKNDKQQGVIRFIDYKGTNKDGKPWARKYNTPTAAWWKRLQSVKVNRKYDVENVELLRKYQKSLSVDHIKKRLINSISTYKVYLSHEDIATSFEEDILDFMSTLNGVQSRKCGFTTLSYL
ncbi:MAG TPA: hypothetical protein VNM69_06670 [Bacillus sp. (in: firmicutes)]|nr:hypothetical protein [Bacillus sp. (in: firmicutes)]